MRTVFTSLYDTLEIAFPFPDTYTLIDDLRVELDELLPPISCNEGLLL